jgi:hypothetical protein
MQDYYSVHLDFERGRKHKRHAVAEVWSVEGREGQYGKTMKNRDPVVSREGAKDGPAASKGVSNRRHPDGRAKRRKKKFISNAKTLREGKDKKRKDGGLTTRLINEIGSEESQYRRGITTQEYYSVHREDGNTRVLLMCGLPLRKLGVWREGKDSMGKQ